MGQLIFLEEAGSACGLQWARESFSSIGKKMMGRCLFFLSARTTLCVSQLSKFILAAQRTGHTLHAASTSPTPRVAFG